jgi:hypothetical protein
MTGTVHSGTRKNSEETAWPGLSGQFAAPVSDTDPPDTTKPAGLGEDKKALGDEGGSDTNSGGGGTKTGLGEN